VSRRTGGERRDSLDELGPALRDRVLALDEPVAWNDWDDVLARSRRARPVRLTRRRLVVGLATVAAAVAASAIGLSLPSLLGVGFGGGGSGAPRELAEFDLGAPASLPPDAIAWQSRLITSVRLRDGKHTLYVAPTTHGGYCYQWTGDGIGGCAELRKGPLAASWGRSQVVGVISASVVSSVKITFTDGTSVEPPIAWVSSPIDAGFFLYDIPAGKIVQEVSGDDDGRTLSQVTWYSV
jgi:hypothetical protein